MLPIPWQGAWKRGKTSKCPPDGSVSQCDCPGGAQEGTRLSAPCCDRSRQLAPEEPEFQFKHACPLSTECFQEFHSGNGTRGAVRGTLSSSLVTSSSAFKNPDGAHFPMSHDYPGSRADGHHLRSALPRPVRFLSGPPLDHTCFPSSPPVSLCSGMESSRGRGGWSRCSVTQLCPALCDPMDCSTPGSPVLRHLLELAQTHVH